MSDTPLTRAHLEAFLEIVDRGSIQAAARHRGHSRATYARYLVDLEQMFAGSELLQRAPGQRTGSVTPAGQELARRARLFLHQWDRWVVGTRDALATTGRAIRVGVLAGAFDLLADVLAELIDHEPTPSLHVIEYPDNELLAGVGDGEVDLGFGTLGHGELPRHLQFTPIGSLPWVVILSRRWEDVLPQTLRLADLENLPLVVTRSGPAREQLEQHFANYEGRPLTFRAAFEVGSSPRVVEAVARGFGIAVVSRFRAAFLPDGVVVRNLADGPAPLTAGAFSRKNTSLPAPVRALLEKATAHFHDLANLSSRP
ncbi:MAG: LysR substrate-binding domain-containing protein [Nannocystaceae bacterium]